MENEPKIKKFAFYNVVILLITVQLVIVINYWYFVFKNIGQASINDTIAYQGKLVDSNGTVVPDGDYNMEFSVYASLATGTPVWTERWDGTSQNSHSGSQVSVVDGIFSVDLNSLCLDWTTGTCITASGVDFSSNSLYLEVKFDSDTNGSMDQTFTPRKRFSSVAYSMNSAKLDGKMIGTSGEAIPLLNGDNTFSGAVIMNVADINLDGLKIVSSQTLDMSNPPASMLSKKVSSWYAGSTLIGAIYPFGTVQSIPTFPSFPAFVAGALPNANPTDLVIGLLGTGPLAIHSDAGIIQLGSPTMGSVAHVGINTTNPTNALDVTINGASEKGVVIKGAYEQTGNLLELQDNASTSLFSVTSSGVLTSGVPEGTMPFSLASTTLITNLNADLLDGIDSLAFVLKAGDTMTGALTIADTTSGLNSGDYTFNMLSGTTGVPQPGTNPSTAGSGVAYYWDFNDSPNSVLTGDVGASDGSIVGPMWANGFFGYSGDYSLQFDGADDNVQFNATNYNLGNSFTIELWVKPGASQVDYADIIDLNHGVSANFVIQQNSSNTNQYYLATYSGVSFQGLTTFTTLTPDVWQHFVIVKNGTSIKHYVDGVETASGAVAETAVWSSAIARFGSRAFADDRYWNGSLDNVVFYNTALTQGTIESHYSDGLPSSAAAVGYVMDTTTILDPTSTLLSIKNANTQKAFIDGDGQLFTPSIIDSANKKNIAFTSVAEAVNFITFTNGSTGVSPVFAADGESNVGLTIKPKGTGSITIPSQSTTAIPLVVKGIVDQTAHLQEWQDSTGAIKASVGFNGLISGLGITLTDPGTENCGKIYTVAGVLTCGTDEIGGGFSGGSLTSLLTLGTLTQTDSVTATDTISVASGRNAYVLTADMGTTAADIDTTYDITGVPNVAGNRFSLDMRVKKGITVSSQTHTIYLKINGTSIGSISYSVSGTSAGELSHGYDFKWNPFTSTWIVTTLY